MNPVSQLGRRMRRKAIERQKLEQAAAHKAAWERQLEDEAREKVERQAADTNRFQINQAEYEKSARAAQGQREAAERAHREAHPELYGVREAAGLLPRKKLPDPVPVIDARSYLGASGMVGGMAGTGMFHRW